MDAIIQAIEELGDMLIEATGGELPEAWRKYGQTGEEAFCETVLNPLNAMTDFVMNELE